MADEKPQNSAGEVKPAAGDGAIASGAPPGQPIPPGAVSAEPMGVPPIALDPAAAKPPPPPAPVADKNKEAKDTTRELIETIVFVVVLVLMLKTFLAEAFVIPTGSMATTLLGYHYKVTCPQCGKPNLVNASSEAEPQPPARELPVTRCQCVNCKFIIALRPDLLEKVQKGEPPQ